MLPKPKRLRAAFEFDKCSRYFGVLETSFGRNYAVSTTAFVRSVFHSCHVVGVAQNRNIGIMRNNNDLSRRLSGQNLRDDKMNHVAITKFILGLINDEGRGPGL